MENKNVVKVLLILIVWALILFASFGGVSLPKIIACLVISIAIIIAPLEMLGKKEKPREKML